VPDQSGRVVTRHESPYGHRIERGVVGDQAETSVGHLIEHVRVLMRIKDPRLTGVGQLKQPGSVMEVKTLGLTVECDKGFSL
jgi:hypothetical protein